MHFILYSNFERDGDASLAGRIISDFETEDVSFTPASSRSGIFNGRAFEKLQDCAEGADAVITLGGDGTVLRAVSDLMGICPDMPVLALNRGRTGFLTESEAEDAGKAIDAVIAGAYDVIERTVLAADFRERRYYALNEVLIYKADISKPITVEADFIGCRRPVSVQADGIFLATPAGSTAYSLSCGGPILSPGTRAVILGSVCPHTVYNRSLIFPDDAVISLGIAKGSREGRLLTDGNARTAVYEGESVSVSRADVTAKFITFDKCGFYDKLATKLNIRLPGGNAKGE